MNIIIVLRFDAPSPKKAVQRYDKKIKNMTFGCGNVLFFSPLPCANLSIGHKRRAVQSCRTALLVFHICGVLFLPVRWFLPPGSEFLPELLISLQYVSCMSRSLR